MAGKYVSRDSTRYVSKGHELNETLHLVGFRVEGME